MAGSSSSCEMVDGEALDANVELFDAKAEEHDQSTMLDMDIDGDGDEDEDEPISKAKKDISVPYILRKMFREEIGDTGASDRRLIATSVHAVLIESGFVALDPVSNMKIERFCLPNELVSSSRVLSIWYTLPEIADEKMEKAVVLKFQNLGKFVSIYGSLTKNGHGTYWARLDKNRLSFFLNLVWADYNMGDGQREVFEFWKTIKDKLALPLMIDLCDIAGLPPPPCFIRLPTELQLMILEKLPAIDIAKTACVSSELRYLSSNEDLWKQKCEEQFGSALATKLAGQWKEGFIKYWVAKNRRIGVSGRRRPPFSLIRRAHAWHHTVTRGVEPKPQFRFRLRGSFVPDCNSEGPNFRIN